MPSFTEGHASHNPEISDTLPISGTGLDIPSLRKTSHAVSGTGPTTPLDGTAPKQYRAPVAKVTARQSINPTPMPSAVGSQSSLKDAQVEEEADSPSKPEEDHQLSLFHQVSEWLQHEKLSRKARTERALEDVDHSQDGHHGSESMFSLNKLEKILLQYSSSRAGNALAPLQQIKRATRRRPKGLRRGSASESDYADVETPVPSVEAFLDNSKTLAYVTGSVAEEDATDSNASLRRAKDREAWLVFKTEIVRLAHTLQLRGWRKVPMESAGDIEVVRLSGALTNAVYVVEPPKHLPPRTENGSAPQVLRKPAPKLLLRIYGPQVEHLIDRKSELQILRRLGRKNIGPRVLGTFQNGRFEEFFEARPLTAKELRLPETAKQIAKRMRELHDGIELLDEERDGGPMIFKNWDKWVDRCEQVTSWLDKEVQSPQNEMKAAAEPWRRRGFICGVPWKVFRKAVDNYRVWLIASLGGIDEIKRQLIFAHNDTQYGNLLRMEPATESPLLLPANEHKQLVVIDFEYSSANTRGFEFANHFTEWCYNYHDEERPWACNNRLYPTWEEQRSFITTYLTHRPAVAGGSTSPLSTPSMRGRTGAAVTPFDLDSSAEVPNWQQAEKSAEEDLEKDVRFLMHQTRLWRVMSSAQWVAWGIVQAKVPGMEEGIAEMNDTLGNNTHENGRQSGEGETKTLPVGSDLDEEDGFDYLAYAQDRAMFLWSDLLALDLVNADELPTPMVEHIRARTVDH